MGYLAVDMSSWSGELTEKEARDLRAYGVRKILVNTWGPWTLRQLEMGQRVGLLLEAYTYQYFTIAPAQRTLAALAAIQGFPVLRLWQDYEDDPAGLRPHEVVAHIRGAVAAAEGVIPQGIYSRRGWWQPCTGACREFMHLPSWVADYDYDPSMLTCSELVDGWRPTIKQYSDSVSLCGQTVCLNWVQEETMPTLEELEAAIAKERADRELGAAWLSAAIAYADAGAKAHKGDKLPHLDSEALRRLDAAYEARPK